LKTVAIVQARLGSNRLPKKTLKIFHGQPIIDWVVTRLKACPLIDEICIAIPDLESEDSLAFHLKNNNINVFRGSETDVLARVCDAAHFCNADIMLRICADNPLVCPDELERLIVFYQKNSFDYAYNHIPLNNSYPDGFGGEICSMKVIDELNRKASTPNHREHLFNFLWDNQDIYSVGTFDAPFGLEFPQLRFDVDTIDDFNYLTSRPLVPTMKAIEIVKFFN
jgi:spore coat polysaccharide biosynthesis protein SpsF